MTDDHAKYIKAFADECIFIQSVAFHRQTEGVYKDRPAKIKAVAIKTLKDEGFGATEIAKKLKIGRASVYRVLESSESA